MLSRASARRRTTSGCGNPSTCFPGYGCIADRLLTHKDPAMPAYVSYPHIIADGTPTPGQFASFLGKQYDPLYVPSDPNDAAFNLPQFSLPDGLTHRPPAAPARACSSSSTARAGSWTISGEARGLDEYYTKALAMLQSPRIRDAFNLAAEPSAIRDRYGRTTYGQGCLLARRLAESGVRS
jgi:hypothetical protein